MLLWNRERPGSCILLYKFLAFVGSNLDIFGENAPIVPIWSDQTLDSSVCSAYFGVYEGFYWYNSVKDRARWLQ
uniref:Uncharacterized protein n=1 Tax=Arundo donax TaxID=35708 RepID=A0A0A9EDX1_ARUDO